MAKMQPIDVAIESLTFVSTIQGPDAAAPAPTDEQVREAEKALGHPLPPSYVAFMRRAGHVLMPKWDLYWVGGPDMDQRRNLVIANELERDHDTSPLPAFLIAFCDDGNSDQYCFDTRRKTLPGSRQSVQLDEIDGLDDVVQPSANTNEYPVVLWDRDQGLGQIRDGLYVVATDFVDWIKVQVHESI